MGRTTAAPVVDAQFRAPHAKAFTVAKAPGSWWWNDLAVTDARGAAVMRAEVVRQFSFRPRVLLLDAASRRPVLTVWRRFSGWKWEAFRGDSTSPADLLFVMRPTRDKVHVHLAGGNQRNPDFLITRHGRNRRESTVSLGNSDSVAVARIIRTVGPFGRFAYNVSVNAGVDHAFILALTMILQFDDE